MIELGKKYKDVLHGFEGVCTAHLKHITEYDKVCLEKMVGDEVKTLWVDVTRLEGVELDFRNKRYSDD